MAIEEWYDWYQQFREENQRQIMEYRRGTQQWIASLKQTTEAQEETRLETNQSFETLCELIRGMTNKETAPSVDLEDGVSINERNQPRIHQEDDRGHPTVDLQANRDNGFDPKIEESPEPAQETEFDACLVISVSSPQAGVDGNEVDNVLLEGRSLDLGKDLPKFIVDVPEELIRVKEIAHPTKDMIRLESSKIPNDILVQSISSKDDDEHLIQVTPNRCEFIKCDSAVRGLGGFVVLLIELMEIRLANMRMDSLDCLRTPSLHKMFAKTPRSGIQLVTGVGVDDSCSNRVIFRPISVACGAELNQDLIKMPYDRGKSRNESVSTGFLMVLAESYNEVALGKTFVFDPGGIGPCW